MIYEIFQNERRPGHQYVAARFWRTAADHAAGKPAHLINDFVLGLRTRHQRIRRGPAGGVLHSSGAEVRPEEIAEFLVDADRWERDDRGRVVRDDRGRWRRRGGGRPVDPFRLGRDQFDPQWKRERFGIAWAAHIDRELTAYAARAAARGWEGDRRGTTSVYQIGAGGDDGYVDSADDIFPLQSWATIGDDTVFASYYSAWFRFTSVTDIAGQTIATAVLALWGYAADTGTPTTTCSFELANAPTNPTDFTDYGGRSKSSTVSWNSPGLSTGGFTNSPDLSAALQDVADGYTSTALQVFHQNNGSTDAFCKAYTYDADTAKAAKLTIDNGVGGGGGMTERPRRPRPIYQR